MSLAIGDIVAVRGRVVQGPHDGRVVLHFLDREGGQHLGEVVKDRVNCKDAFLCPAAWCEPAAAEAGPAVASLADGVGACDALLGVIDRDLGGGSAIGTWVGDAAVVGGFRALCERMKGGVK